MKMTIILFTILSTSAFCAHIGVVTNSHGNAFNINSNKSLSTGDKVYSGDVIKTYPNGHVSILTNSKTAFHITNDTVMKIEDENTVVLKHGNLWVSSINFNKKVILTSKSKIQFIKGNFLIESNELQPDSYISMSGNAFITNSQGHSIQINKREFASLDKGVFSAPQAVTLEKYSLARSKFAHVRIDTAKKIHTKRPKRSIASVSFVAPKVIKKLSRAKVKVHGSNAAPTIKTIPVKSIQISRSVSSIKIEKREAKKEFSIDQLIEELKEVR